MLVPNMPPVFCAGVARPGRLKLKALVEGWPKAGVAEVAPKTLGEDWAPNRLGVVEAAPKAGVLLAPKPPKPV